MIRSDSELIIRVLVDDDRAAFGELVQRHQSAVRRFLRHLTRGNAALADDLAQETFIQAYRGLAKFRGTSAFATWLLGIAHNHYRNARRRQRPEAFLSEEDAINATAFAPTRSADLQHDLSNALRQLSAEEQTIFHLCYQLGFSHSEAALALDCPAGTVKTHLARGKDKLRQLLTAWNPSP